jgi:hypothetical protein
MDIVERKYIDLTSESDTESVDSVDIFAPYTPPHATATAKSFSSSSSSAPLTLPLEKAPAPAFPDLTVVEHKYDFTHLREHGYQVIDAPVLTTEECEARIAEFWDWLESQDRGLKRDDPTTWSSDAWPSNIHGIVQYPSAAHTYPVWKVRTHPNVVKVFSELWNTSPYKLQTSFDRVCIQRPTTRKMPQKPWLHIDQGPRLRGERCFQGFVTLADMPATGGTLVIMPGSHKFHDEFFARFPKRVTDKVTVTNKVTGEQKQVTKNFSDNWVKFTQEELDWWAERGCKPLRVSAKAGQLVLWDSRTVHQGSYPLPESAPLWRWVVYVCMKPTPTTRDPASRKKLERAMAKKREAFEQGRTTSHWAVPERYTKRTRTGKVTEEWMGTKNFAVKPQYSHDQKPEPRTSLKIRTVEELRKVSPLGPILAGYPK